MSLNGTVIASSLAPEVAKGSSLFRNNAKGDPSCSFVHRLPCFLVSRYQPFGSNDTREKRKSLPDRLRFESYVPKRSKNKTGRSRGV